jgi:hypothetical protein
MDGAQGMTLKVLRQGKTPMDITRWSARGGFNENLFHNL